MLCSRLLLCAVVMSSSAGLAAGAGADKQPPAACVITRPPNPPFVPPLRNLSNMLRSDQVWYGTESLWTYLDVSGRWGNIDESKGGYSTKLIYWRRGFDWRKEPEPELIVTARRLDRKTPIVTVEHANAVFVTGPLPAAMMTGLDIPTAGCWEIKAQYHDQTLSFTVSVEPRLPCLRLKGFVGFGRPPSTARIHKSYMKMSNCSKLMSRMHFLTKT